MTDKYIRNYLNKVFGKRTSNAIYNVLNFLNVLLEAAQTNGFLEGTCNKADGACDAETIFIKLNANIDVDKLFAIFIELIKPQLREIRKQIRNRKIVIAFDITDEPYYGDNHNEWIHKYKPAKGCTGCYRFMVVSIVIGGRRYIVGILPLKVGDKREAIMEKLLNEIKGYMPIDTVLLDRGFNSSRVIILLKKLRLNYLILWKKHEWSRNVFEQMKKKKFKILTRTLEIKEEDGEVVTIKTNMVFVKGIKVKGDKKAYNWLFATNIEGGRPIKYIYMYKKRWAIETVFRVTDELWIRTKTTNMVKRFFLVLFTILLYNAWKWFNGVTEENVTFSEFTYHFHKVLEKYMPKRELKPRQQKIRDLMEQSCFSDYLDCYA